MERAYAFRVRAKGVAVLRRVRTQRGAGGSHQRPRDRHDKQALRHASHDSTSLRSLLER